MNYVMENDVNVIYMQKKKQIACFCLMFNTGFAFFVRPKDDKNALNA